MTAKKSDSGGANGAFREAIDLWFKGILCDEVREIEKERNVSKGSDGTSKASEKAL